MQTSSEASLVSNIFFWGQQALSHCLLPTTVSKTLLAALSLRRSQAAWATMYANSSYRETPPCLLTRSYLSMKNFILVYNMYIMQCDHIHPHRHTVICCFFSTPADSLSTQLAHLSLCRSRGGSHSAVSSWCIMVTSHPEDCFIALLPILQILTIFFMTNSATFPWPWRG